MGDFRLDISTITNEKLKKIAEQANTNKTTEAEAKVLDAKEASVFEDMLARALWDPQLSNDQRITHEEYDMGLALVKGAKSENKKGVTNPQQTQEPKTPFEQRYDELQKMFLDIKTTMETSAEGKAVLKKEGGHNFKAYLKMIKDELKNTKVKDADGKEVKAWKLPYTKEAFEKLEKDVKNGSVLQNIEAIKQRYAGNEEAYGDVSSISKRKGFLGIGHKKNKTVKAWEQVAENKTNAAKRYDELESVSRKEMEKGLKLKFAKVFSVKKGKTEADKFERFKKDDGTYDLRPVRDVIDEYYGADAEANRSVDRARSELHNIAKKLSNITGYSFNEYEAKKVIEFVGISNQRRDHSLKTAFLGEDIDNADLQAASAIAGATAGAVFTPVVEQVNQSIIKAASREEAETKIGQICKGAVYKGMTSDGRYIFENLQYVDLRALAAVAGVFLNIGIETLTKMIIGTEVSEKTCFHSDEAYSHIDSLKEFKENAHEYFANDDGTKAALISQLANEYVEQYKDLGETKALKKLCDNLYVKMAGRKSTANTKECIGMQLDMAKQNAQNPTQPTPPATPTPQPTPPTPPTPPTTPTTPTTQKQKCAVVTPDFYEHRRKGGDTWEGIVRAYYPCLIDKCGGQLYGPNGAIRKLKVALAGGDPKKLQALLRGGDLPAVMMLPKEIDGCQRVDGAKVTPKKVKGNGSALVQRVGNGQWIAKDKDDPSKYTIGSSHDDALGKLNDKYGQDGKYTEC